MDNVVFVSEQSMMGFIKEFNKQNNVDYTMVFGSDYTILRDFSNKDVSPISYDNLLRLIIHAFNNDVNLYHANNKLIEEGITTYSLFFDLYHDQHRKKYIIYWQSHTNGMPKLKEEYKNE